MPWLCFKTHPQTHWVVLIFCGASDALSGADFLWCGLQELKLNILLHGEVESLAPLLYQISRCAHHSHVVGKVHCHCLYTWELSSFSSHPSTYSPSPFLPPPSVLPSSSFSSSCLLCFLLPSSLSFPFFLVFSIFLSFLLPSPFLLPVFSVPSPPPPSPFFSSSCLLCFLLLSFLLLVFSVFSFFRHLLFLHLLLSPLLPSPHSPWYNCSGWLGVKHQVAYLLLLPRASASFYQMSSVAGNTRVLSA